MNVHPSLIFAMLSAMSFALASVLFAVYSKKFSALWMGAIKASVAFITFGIVVLFEIGLDLKNVPPLGLTHFTWFFSGFIGLAFGDWALLKGFVRLGAARTLMIFSFSPVVLSIGGYLFFNQSIRLTQFFAIALLILCVFCLSLEKYKKSGHWEFVGFLFAFTGVFCDDLGIMLSRLGFDRLPETTPLFANWIRTLGSLFGFFLIHRFIIEIPFIKNLVTLTRSQLILLFIACFFGTFLSLSFWLYAIKTGHLASIAAIGMTGPLFATVFESVYERNKPSTYLCVSLGLFVLGIILMHY